MENQKKEKNKKRIVLIVVLLLCCCTCVAVFVKKGIAKKSDRSVVVDAQTVDIDKQEAGEKAETTDRKKEEKQHADKKEEKQPETVASVSGKTTEASADTNPKTTETASGKPETKTTEAPAKQNTTEAPTKPKTTESAPKTTESVTAPSASKTTEATTEAPKTTETQKQKVWVVDQAAYDEEYPVYETRCRMICRNCGGYMYTQQDIDNHPCYSQVASSWYDEYYDVQVGTETIHHDEIGHWEWEWQ